MLRLAVFALVALSIFASPYFSPVSTRDDCPPEGFTAISSAFDLSRLPPHGKYAICLTTQEFTDLTDGVSVNFEVHGVWKLSHSTLLVDQNIRIVAHYPSRLEWEDVIVGEISPNVVGDWAGIEIHGAPTNLVHPGYLHSSRYGNCGSLVNVGLDEVEDDEPFQASLTLINCSRATTLKNINIVSDDGDNIAGLLVQDSTDLVFMDLLATTDSTSVEIRNSKAAFIRPVMYTDDGDVFEVSDGSCVTLCDPLMRVGDDSDDVFVLGGDSDNGEPNRVFVSGGNLFFPEALATQGAGGLLITLRACPNVFSCSYDPKTWENFHS